MAVTTTHASYDAARLKWQRLRDVIAGEDAMIARCVMNARSQSTGLGEQFGRVYIPRLNGLQDHEYYSYVDGACLFNATSRTVDALVGMIMAKPAEIKLPAQLEAYQDDITLSACPLREFVQQVIVEEISITRVGILVDYPAVNPAGLSRAAAEQMNLRPFLRHYTGETIINWRSSAVNGANVLTLVVLAENIEVPGDDEFSTNSEVRYRVLDLTEQGYRVRILNEKGELLSEAFPLMNGAAMTFIPFAIVGGPAIRKPVLLELCDTNIKHYRNSAQFERGLGFTSPVPVVTGVSLEPGQVLSIGSTNAWVFSDPAADAKYMEFSGQGLQPPAEAMKEKQQLMAILGARMLTDEKRAAEAEQTVSMRTASERSVLAATAGDVADAMRQCLRWMAQWAGANPDAVNFTLNVDYGAQRMNAQMLTALVGAWQTGAIPLQVLFTNLQRGEVAAADMEFDTFEAQLSDQGPALETPSQESPAQTAGLMQSIRATLGL